MQCENHTCATIHFPMSASLLKWFCRVRTYSILVQGIAPSVTVSFFFFVPPSLFICTSLVVVNSLPYCIVIFILILAIFQNISFLEARTMQHLSMSVLTVLVARLIISPRMALYPIFSAFTPAMHLPSDYYTYFLYLSSTLISTHFIFILIEFHLPFCSHSFKCFTPPPIT